MPRLRRLTLSAQATEPVLETLAAAPWWPQLEHFDGMFFGLTPEASWAALWRQRRLSLREARLSFPYSKQMAEMLYSEQLPTLMTLALCGELRDDLFPLLDGARLPALRDLDLRRCAVTEAGFAKFAKSKRTGLPALERVGAVFLIKSTSGLLPLPGIPGWIA